MHLSVVIPAYNEETRLSGTLDSVLEFLAGQACSSEVIVVDDGSTDGTAAIVRDFPARATPLQVVSHPDRKNHGKGAAVRLGMLSAQGRFRLYMDADNSTTLDHVLRFWPAFDAGFPVVIGSRSIEGSRITVRQPWYKETAGRFGNRVIQALAVPGIRDTQAGFKMFTAAAAEAIFSRLTVTRWGFDVEALVIARALGFRVKELPITWVNAPGSKVRATTYFEVLLEVWHIRRNLKSGLYR